MIFARPMAGLRYELRVVTRVGVGDSPVISTTSGAWLYDRKMPAMVLPSFAAESWKPKIPAELNARSEEHTSELQSPDHLVCRLLLEKKKKATCNLRLMRILPQRT